MQSLIGRDSKVFQISVKSERGGNLVWGMGWRD